LLQATHAQRKNAAKEWTTSDPFKTDVFIENYGQFNNWINSKDTVKYAINNSQKIFFLPTGIIYRLDIVEKEEEEKAEISKAKPEEEHRGRMHSYYVKMLWKGCNANAKIEATGESQGYYTFGEKGYENVKAKGYSKIVYKDLYPGIDAEYTIPAKGGIKYKLVMHPGADLGAVRMLYSGDVENILSDSLGNIDIKTPAGNIVDHAPFSFYTENKTPVSLAFGIKSNVISFNLKEQLTTNDKKRTLIIDPWTTVTSALITDNAAYDVDFDDHGNVYISGGTPPHQLAKYSSAGNLLWTFTNPATWAPTYFGYSKFCLIPQNETVFIGEGWNDSGPRIMKINAAGSLITTSPYYAGSEEIWVMFYNRCNNQICGFGGGTQTPNNIQQVTDTNLTTSNVSCFNTYGSPGNDISSVQMDYNGDFFALAPSTLYGVSGPNSLEKSLISANYNPPCAFDVSTGYNFGEGQNSGIPGFSGSGCYAFSNRANALALNINYVFSYDGITLIAWDKANGTQLGSVIVDPSYSGGMSRTHEGVTVDNCNNVYVGGTNKVHEYSFNGSVFTPSNVYTNYIPNEVYDLNIDKTSDVLYVCGLGFVSSFPVTSCPVNQLSISTHVDSCINAATVTVNSGTPPFTYLWSNGATSSTISGVPSGTYTVTVVDNSCILKNGIDTVVINAPYVMNINHDTTICSGTPVILSAQGANSYSWSPSTGLSSTTGSSVTATPNVTTTYTVTGTFPNGCTASLPVTVTIGNPPDVFISNDTSICNGGSVMLHTGGGLGYIWSPSASLDNATISNPTAHPTTTTTYTVSISTAGCNVTKSVTITVKTINAGITPDTSICSGEPAYLHASGGNTYFWIPPNGINNQYSSSPVATPDSSTTYFVTISDGGCEKVESVFISVYDCTLIIPNVFTPNGDEINDVFNIEYDGIESYSLIIFNRWGKIVYTTNDKNLHWNGKTPDGRNASEGVYYYILDVGPKTYHGTVTLLR